MSICFSLSIPAPSDAIGATDPADGVILVRRGRWTPPGSNATFACMTAVSPEPRRRTGSSARVPLVSVVIELYTHTVTGRIPVEARVRALIDRRGGLTEHEVEYLLVGPQAIDTQEWGRNVASIAVPEG